MVYDLENHYTERQKKIVSNVFKFLLEEKYKNVKKEFDKRKIINYCRNIIKNFKIFVMSIINK